MRDLTELNHYRVKTQTVLELYGSFGDEYSGVFHIPFKNSKKAGFQVIASSGEGWDHVSVCLTHRTPSWDEMERIKRLFFKPDELAIQYNLPPTKHINIHPYCLHLWRPINQVVPLPPEYMV